MPSMFWGCLRSPTRSLVAGRFAGVLIGDGADEVPIQQKEVGRSLGDLGSTSHACCASLPFAHDLVFSRGPEEVVPEHKEQKANMAGQAGLHAVDAGNARFMCVSCMGRCLHCVTCTASTHNVSFP